MRWAEELRPIRGWRRISIRVIRAIRGRRLTVAPKKVTDLEVGVAVGVISKLEGSAIRAPDQVKKA